MHPILLSLGPFVIYFYGAFMALGVVAGTWLSCRLGKDEGFTSTRIQNTIIWVMLAAIVGARIFYVLIEPSDFIKQPWRFFYVWEGGLVFYGGVILSVLTTLLLAKYWKISALGLWDSLAPGVALAQVFGRIGCFMAGCCHGKKCDLPIAVTFTDPNSLAPTGVPLIPSQLIEAVAMLFITLILLWFWPRRKQVKGRMVFLLCILAGLERMGVELIRGDWRGEALQGIAYLTPTAVTSMIIFVIGLFGFIILTASKGKRLQ